MIRFASTAALALAATTFAGTTFAASDLHAQSVTHRRKDKPPYYHGNRPPVNALIAWTPITTPAIATPGTRQSDGVAPMMRLLLDTLDVAMATLMGGAALDSARLPLLIAEGAPEIRFGCEPEFGGETTRIGRWYHSAGCEEPEPGEQPYNELAIRHGARRWKKQVASALHDGTGYVLMLQLRIADQYPWSGFRGKGVRLGTGHDASLPWLSAVDRPLTVVQLVGALVDREGNVVRAGAEGLLASKPGALTTLLGGQQAVDERQIAELVLASRRADLPGAPLTWEVALRTLVGELTNKDFAAR